MRTFFDTEFIENGDRHPIIPVSIGLVKEDGDNYYAEFKGVDWSKANSWVLENIKPNIGKSPELIKPKEQIAQEIVQFVGPNPEFWAYYASYDWVILGQLYGSFVEQPQDWPQNCLDIRQYMWHLGVTRDDIPYDNENEHNALADAIWNFRVFTWLIEYH